MQRLGAEVCGARIRHGRRPHRRRVEGIAMKNALTCLVAVPCLLYAGTLMAQNYPTKPIRIITGGAGSNGDFASRLIAPVLTASLGQQIVVENRQSGIILGDTVAKSPPDGYTVMITGSSFWLAPFLQSNVSWDPI